MLKNKKLLSVLAGLLTALLLFSLMSNVLPEPVSAASSSEIKDQLEDLEEDKEELDAQIKELREQMSDNLEEMEAMVQQKTLIDQEMGLLYQKQENLNNQISAYALLIADKQEEIEFAQQELEQLQEKYKARIRAMEENGSLNYWSVIFKASSFMDMLDRTEMMLEIKAADERCLVEMDAAAKQVAQAKATLETEQEALQGSRLELETLQAELEVKRTETDVLLIQMEAKGKEYEAMMEESEAKQHELMEEIAKKEDEYDKAKYQEWLSTSRPVSGGNTVGGITWLMPCAYNVVTDTFGMRWHPISGKWKQHDGIDLAGRKGTPIKATRAGYVSIADYQKGGAGYYVQINHGDGYKSIYMHMSSNLQVSVGQYVEAGQVVGYMDTTGGSTGVHLHFGISYNGVYQNPANFLRFY